MWIVHCANSELTDNDRYVLFSIGNIKPLLEHAFPECWEDKTICNPTWIAALDYLEICGIIVGQMFVGVIGDWLGRRFGLIQDALIMFGGLLMLTAAWGVTMSESNPNIIIAQDVAVLAP